MNAFEQISGSAEPMDKNIQNHLAATNEIKPEFCINLVGSSHVLGDIFEFSDYLTPCTRFSRKFEAARRSLGDDSYAELFCF